MAKITPDAFRQMDDLLYPTEASLDIYSRALFEHASIGVIVADRQHRIVRANPAFCAMLGYGIQDLQGLSYQELTNDVCDSVTPSHLVSQQRQFRCANGQNIVCLSSIIELFDDENVAIGKLILAQENRKTVYEDNSIRRLRTLETLLDDLPIPILFKDTGLHYRLANHAAHTFFGLKPELIVGRSNEDLFPPALAEQIQQLDLKILNGQSCASPADTPVADANGQLHYVSIYKSPMRDENDHLVGILDLLLDVTERRLAESERLTQLQGQRDALIQEVHHRIKNHLQGVVGLLQRAISVNPLLTAPLRGVLAQIESIAGIHGLQSRLRGQCLKFGQVATMIADLTPGLVSVTGDGLDAALPHHEAVPFALTLNELVSNALKHRCCEANDHPVTIQLQIQEPNLIIKVSSSSARLPPGFDFSSGQGLGTGLRLLKTLLPSQGATLSYDQQGDEVVAKLRLMPPLVKLPDKAVVAND